ncbi:MAG: glucose-6-phosphate isomerase, partial [Desulfobacterales bacterium]
MLAKKNPTTTKSWQNLCRHYEKMKDLHMRTLFAEDPRRFDKLSIRFNDMIVDYSKNRITEETLKSLIALAEECDLSKAIDSMFAGKKINETENRAVLHTALRNRDNAPVMVDGQDVMPQVNAVLKQMEDFSNQVIAGDWQGYTGKKI